MYEKKTTSPALSFTLCGNEVHLPGFTSSAMHSMYSRAPYSFQILPAILATLRYFSTFFLGTGKTKPSTYFAISLSLFKLWSKRKDYPPQKDWQESLATLSRVV